MLFIGLEMRVGMVPTRPRRGGERVFLGSKIPRWGILRR
jgi:hypothetical protein